METENTVGRSVETVNTEPPQEPTAPCLGTDPPPPAKLKAESGRDACTPVLEAAVFTAARGEEEAVRGSVVGGINELWSIHSRLGSSLRKEGDSDTCHHTGELRRFC